MLDRRCLLRLFPALAIAPAAVFRPVPAFAVGSLVDVELVDRGDDRSGSEVLPVYPYRGTSWLAGRPGSRYAVRLRNRSNARVLVVLSIDGVNAVSGETAAVDQTGYVLAPYQVSEITGWRKSLSESAAFYFTALPDSYAARTDRPDNVGVIGAAVFREKVREKPRLTPPDFSRLPTPIPAPLGSLGQIQSEPGPDRATDSAARAAAPAGKTTSAIRDERLGTGHGEREYTPTHQVDFERAGEQPNEVVRLRYDSRERLVALGVIPPQAPPQPRPPEPFPKNAPGFVPDPRG